MTLLKIEEDPARQGVFLVVNAENALAAQYIGDLRELKAFLLNGERVVREAERQMGIPHFSEDMPMGLRYDEI